MRVARFSPRRRPRGRVPDIRPTAIPRGARAPRASDRRRCAQAAAAPRGRLRRPRHPRRRQATLPRKPLSIADDELAKRRRRTIQPASAVPSTSSTRWPRRSLPRNLVPQIRSSASSTSSRSRSRRCSSSGSRTRTGVTCCSRVCSASTSASAVPKRGMAAVRAAYRPIDDRLRRAGVRDFSMLVVPLAETQPRRSDSLAIAHPWSRAPHSGRRALLVTGHQASADDAG